MAEDSRLMLGTAQYPSPAILAQAFRRSGAGVATVSLRREAGGERAGQVPILWIHGANDPMAPAVLHLEAEHESVRIGIYDDFIQPPPPPPRGAEEGEGGRARSAAEATVELEAERRPNDRRSQADMRALDLLSGEAEDDPPSPARLEADVRAGLSSEC